MAYRFVHPFFDVGSGIVPADGAKLRFFDVGTSNPHTSWSNFALTIANSVPVIAGPTGRFDDIFLDVSVDATLTDKNDVPIWGPDTVYPPNDSIATLAAAIVSVADTGGNFAANNVETVLAEIATGWLKLNRANTVSGTQTFNGANLEMADNLIIRPEIKDYSVTHNVISSVSGTLTVDMSTGNSFITTLTENITTFTITNPPATGKEGAFTLRVIQDAGGGAYTMAGPTGVIYPGGTAWVVSTGNGAKDKGTYTTIDAGTAWEIDFSQGYA